MKTKELLTRRTLQAMAFDRKTFKDKLQDILGGAITHFYMVQLATLNKQSKWVKHWQSEVDRLINMDAVRVLVSRTKGNWDKRKALAESMADVAAADEAYRRTAANYVNKVYRLKKVNRKLPDDIQSDFYAAVESAAEHALDPTDDASASDN
jgi:hypothetical protein